MSRRILKAEEILICKDLPREFVPTPEWSPVDANGDECGVLVATMDADSKERWEDEVTNNTGRPDPNKLGHIRAITAVHCCVDESGNPTFTRDQIDELSKTSCVPLTRIWDTFRRLNVLTDADVSELAKN